MPHSTKSNRKGTGPVLIGIQLPRTQVLRKRVGGTLLSYRLRVWLPRESALQVNYNLQSAALKSQRGA